MSEIILTILFVILGVSLIVLGILICYSEKIRYERNKFLDDIQRSF